MSFLEVLIELCLFLPEPFAATLLIGICVLGIVILLKILALILDAIPFL